MIGIILLLLALGLTIYNLAEDYIKGQNAADIISEFECDDEDIIADPETGMPIRIIDGITYLGIVELPDMDASFPIIATCGEKNLAIAPCRYKGSIYENNMVIAGHNYTSQFGKLYSLKLGDEVLFRDLLDNTFEYEVRNIEIVDPYDVEKMIESDSDLTLFTCTLGGKTRLTIRCKRIRENVINTM